MQSFDNICTLARVDKKLLQIYPQNTTKFITI